MNRTIITVVGKDTVGIMIVDMAKMKKSFEDIADELKKIGEDMGVQVKCQREEIFDMMHRI